MTGRRRHQVEESPAPAESAPTPAESAPAGSELVLVAGDSQGVRRAPRAVQADPLLEVVERDFMASLGAPKYYQLGTEEEVRRVKNLLAAVRKSKDMGLKQSVSSDGNNGYILDFEALPEPIRRKYTSAEIKGWAKDRYGEIKGRIPTEIRDAFKEANGYAPSADGTE